MEVLQKGTLEMSTMVHISATRKLLLEILNQCDPIEVGVLNCIFTGELLEQEKVESAEKSIQTLTGRPEETGGMDTMDMKSSSSMNSMDGCPSTSCLDYVTAIVHR